MKKKIIGLCLIAGLILSSVLPAQAATKYGNPDWSVIFTAGSSMNSNFKTADMDEVVDNMQPGDNVIITIKLINQHKATTDWYMTNRILRSLEDGSVANGGAYTYKLSYESPDGKTTELFDSDRIGGESVSGNDVSGNNVSGNNVSGNNASGTEQSEVPKSEGDKAGQVTLYADEADEETVSGDDVSGDDVSGDDLYKDSKLGLHEATNSMQEYFKVDTLTRGQSGKITLEITLDGETLGNGYQKTLADLTMDFAVERRPMPKNTYKSPREVIQYLSQLLDEDVPLAVRRDTVRTSDDDRLIYFAVLTFVSGLALFILSMYCRKAGRKEEE